MLLKGRYELLETLGSGGEARVVKALHRQHARFVALKVRPLATSLDRDELLREATVLLGLTPHPSLPLVREDFFDGDQYVIVMDWVNGTDLARLVRDNGAPGLPLSSVLEYLAEAAEALTFLHTQQVPIIHGDVKPANMILTRGGHVTAGHGPIWLSARHGRVAVDNDCNGDVVFGDLAHRRIMRRVHVGDGSTDMTLSPTGRSLIVRPGGIGQRRCRVGPGTPPFHCFVPDRLDRQWTAGSFSRDR